MSWLCNECVSFANDEYDEPIVECYNGCNEESVEYGEVVVIESMEKYECVSVYEGFVDE